MGPRCSREDSHCCLRWPCLHAYLNHKCEVYPRLGTDPTARGIHRMLSKLCCLCGSAHWRGNKSFVRSAPGLFAFSPSVWGSYCLQGLHCLCGVYTIYVGCPAIWVHPVYKVWMVLRSLYEGEHIWTRLIRAMLFKLEIILCLSITMFIGALHCPRKSHIVYGFYIHHRHSVWVLTVTLSQLFSNSIHFSKYILPAYSMTTAYAIYGYSLLFNSDHSHEINRCLLLGRKAMTSQDSVLKSRDITLPTKICIVKTMVFPVVMYRCERWIIKKAECQRFDAFGLWCWRRLLRVPWTARSNQSFLKEINSEYSLEGLMLKLEL